MTLEDLLSLRGHNLVVSSDLWFKLRTKYPDTYTNTGVAVAGMPVIVGELIMPGGWAIVGRQDVIKHHGIVDLETI